MPIKDDGLSRGSQIIEYLSPDGGTTKDIIQDYSGASPTEISWAADDWCHISRLIVSIVDTAGFRADRYADLGSALTNGIELFHRDGNDNVLLDITGGRPVTTNSHWTALCFDGAVQVDANFEVLGVRFTFDKTGKGLLFAPNDKFVLSVHDDFTGILYHTFMIQGNKL